MIKIKLSRDIESKHIVYFEKFILPNILKSKTRHYVFNPRDAANAVKKDSIFFQKKFLKQHNHFVGFIKNNYRIFAAGKWDKLYELQEKIERLFPLLINMIGSEYKNGNGERYYDYLYGMFGYEGFRVKDLYYYLKLKAQKNVNKERYCVEVQREMVRLLISYFPKLNVQISARLLPARRSFTSSEFEKEFKQLSNINITLDNFKEIDIFKLEWNDYFLIMESGLRVCPYCNRQYITPIYSDKGKMRADIDHFLSKRKFPFFSMSLYNLVPVCKPCNQSFKHDKEFGFSSINPYEDNLDDYFSFKVDVITNEISVETRSTKSDEINMHLDTFKIEAMYNYHRNQAEEIIKKRITYTEDYIKKLYLDNRDYFDDESDVEQFIVGYIKDKSKLNDEAFLKFRRDIAEQLEFIDGKPNDQEIILLKNKLLKMLP